ncbi:class I SAM-dependent methyltransferase [Ferruginibacter yonginensis]|uniref:Class I SAM-dependent methyltransferase n=1 Tax=Ferruginibacter yonginensis TaxID=1310416 RepID=A0ABV8QSC8_9BACT
MSSPASTSTQTAEIIGNFYQKIILGMFQKMEHGQMRIDLPNAQTLYFGNDDGTLQANINIKTFDFFKRCVLYGDIGFGEAYTDGDWDTDNITNVIKWFLLNIDNAPSVSGSSVKSIVLNLLKAANKISHLRNKNSLTGSRKNIAAHYDLSNDFFALFLDETMTYSSAYFADKNLTLQQAQEAKYDRLCKQLHLKPTDHVLEIGSGWGGNAIFMAKNYGCKVTTLTISEEQFKLANERIVAAGLQDKITVLIQDYRTMTGTFDKIVSVEMIEAVGHKYLKAYFKKCHELLHRQGILAIQAITCPDSRYHQLRKGVDWIQKHIFPGSLLPSVAAMNNAINQTGDLTLVDLKDIGLDYATTLATWRMQFNNNAAHIRSLGFDEAFLRKWNYYFSYCEAAFAMRNINVMQLVYTRPNVTIR